MKTTFYCVGAEFYDTREVKACMTETQAVKKPNNQFKRVYGLTAFKFYTPRQETAIKMVEYLKSGEMYIDGAISFFETMALLEKNNPYHAAFEDWLARRVA